MLVNKHILTGIIFSFVLGILINLNFLQITLIFLASTLIDVDHYLIYIWRKKDWNLKNAYNFHIKETKLISILAIFHTIEFHILILILSITWTWFLFILIGMIFHCIFDIVSMYLNDEKRIFCFISYLILKRKHPEKYF